MFRMLGLSRIEESRADMYMHWPVRYLHTILGISRADPKLVQGLGLPCTCGSEVDSHIPDWRLLAL